MSVFTTGLPLFHPQYQLKSDAQAIIFAILFLVAPMANNDFTRRSGETVGSPFSIFATRDWLDFIFALDKPSEASYFTGF